jgi:hypothetical protein
MDMMKPIAASCDWTNAPKIPNVFMLKIKKVPALFCVVMRLSE